MTSSQFWIFAAELFIFGIASFLAIIVWSKTREIPWLFMVIAVLSLYASSILHALDLLGAVNLDPVVIGDVSPVRILVQIVPGLALISGFIAYIRGRL